MNPSAPLPPGGPLVVQVAFAGARQLLDRAAHPGVDPAQFEAALQPLLTERLRRLPAELGLHPERHPVCGLSSLAIGGGHAVLPGVRSLAVTATRLPAPVR